MFKVLSVGPKTDCRLRRVYGRARIAAIPPFPYANSIYLCGEGKTPKQKRKRLTYKLTTWVLAVMCDEGEDGERAAVEVGRWWAGGR
jgi:hypothetical protein